MTAYENKSKLGLAVAFIVTLVVLATTLVMTRDSQRRTMDFFGPTYTSIEELAASADLVVTGIVGDVAGRQIDYGGQTGEDRGSGLPIALYEFRVTEVIAGQAPPGQILVVAVLDPAIVASDHVVELSNGDEGLFYLRAESTKTAPGVDSGPFYTPLNDNNGILRIEGNDVAATGKYPLAISDTDAQVIEETLGREEADGKISARQPLRTDLASAIAASR